MYRIDGRDGGAVGGAAAVGLTTGTSGDGTWPISGALLGAMAGIGLALWWTRAQPPE